MSPEAFVELLAVELQAAGVVVGSNYRFGYRAAGTAELLQQLGPQHGMRVQVLSLVASQQASGTAGAAAAASTRTAAAGAPPQQQQGQQQQADLGQVPHPRLQPPQQQQQLSHQQQHPSQQQRDADREEARAAVSSSRVRHALAAGNMHDAAVCLGRPYRLVASLADAASSALPDGAALRLPAEAVLNQPPGPGRYQVEAIVVGCDTREVLLPSWRALAGLDETGLTLHGSDSLLAQLPPGAQHLALDFL